MFYITSQLTGIFYFSSFWQAQHSNKQKKLIIQTLYNAVSSTSEFDKRDKTEDKISEMGRNSHLELFQCCSSA